MIWIILGIIVVLVLIVVGVYNGLVKSRMQTREAWSQIDVQLKRRNDLIPNLIETVKGSLQAPPPSSPPSSLLLHSPRFPLCATPSLSIILRGRKRSYLEPTHALGKSVTITYVR